jgi:putative methyltransferase (TIGR04325 family)
LGCHIKLAHAAALSDGSIVRTLPGAGWLSGYGPPGKVSCDMGDEPTDGADRNRLLPETYLSYEAALAECGVGYDDAALNAVRFVKAANVIQGLLSDPPHGQVATALETVQMFRIIRQGCGPDLRVLDFGGGFALSYFLLRGWVPGEYRWAVVETPMAAAMGRAFETDALRFFDSIGSAEQWLGDVDVVHSNAALQYVPSPEDFLDRLLSIGASYLALLRCNLSGGRRTVQIQQSMLSMQYIGPLPAGVPDKAIRYPHTSLAQDVFDSKIADSGYVLVASSAGTERGTDEIGMLHDNHRLYRRMP